MCTFVIVLLSSEVSVVQLELLSMTNDVRRHRGTHGGGYFISSQIYHLDTLPGGSLPFVKTDIITSLNVRFPYVNTLH